MRNLQVTVGSLLLASLLASCAGSDPEGVGGVATQSHAIWTNGDFEGDAIGSAPSSWLVSRYTNPGVTVQSPQTFAGLNLTPTTGFTASTVVVGGATNSQFDASLGSGSTLRYPRYGVRAAVVNNGIADTATGPTGRNQHAQSISQDMVVSVNDIDPDDGNVHIRFVVAPVLEDPNHAAREQPYYFVLLTNVSKGNAVVYQDFQLSNQPGVPWKSVGSAKYTDWLLTDLQPNSATVAMGDTLRLQVIAAGCSLGGHWGRIYVDSFGATVPGVFIKATGPQYSNAGSNITYTFSYKNGGTATAAGTIIKFTVPDKTTFQSISLPGCTKPAVGGTGLVTCNIGALGPSQSGTFTITVNANLLQSGTVTNGNYTIESTGVSPLLGPRVLTQLTTLAAFADLWVTKTANRSSVNWGESVVYTVTVGNDGPTNATGVTVSDPMPTNLASMTWTCAPNNVLLASCPAASGSGSINHTTVALASGGRVTYTVTGTLNAGTGTGWLSNAATASISGLVIDPDTNNNSDGVAIPISDSFLLSVTKSSDGSVTSTPDGISCLGGCTAASQSFAQGSTVILTAIAPVNTSFTGWGGACASFGTAKNCTITMDAAKTVSATFAAAGPPALLTVSSGSPQTTAVGTTFGSLLAALVTDASGTPLQGVTVNFTVPGSGASATLTAASAVTEANGIATVGATANATPGTYNVAASVTGIAAPIQFALTNQAFNVAPVNTLPATATVNEDATTTLAGISVADADAASGTLTLTFTATQSALLSLGSSTGVTVTGANTSTLGMTGTLTNLNAALATLRITPAANFFGTLTVTMAANDNGNTGAGSAQTDSDVMTVTVNDVNDPPTVVADTATVAKNSLTGVLIDVLANDSSAPDVGETLTIASVTTPARGTATIEANKIRFVPTAGFSGSDTFSYTVGDGRGGTASATVTVTISGTLAVNAAPVNTLPAQSGMNEDTTLALLGLAVADADAGSAPITVTLSISGGALTVGMASGVTITGNASGSVQLVGTVTNLNTALGNVVYAPAANANGAFVLTMATNDGGNTGTGGAQTDSDQTTINVAPVNDPPTVVADTALVTSNSIVGVLINVLANDSSAPDVNETLTIQSITTATSGTASLESGQIRYVPATGFAGTATFSYTVSDGNGGTASAQVTVTVSSTSTVNSPPVNTLAATASVDEDQTLTFNAGVADADAGSAAISVQLSVSGGVLHVATTGGVVIDGNDTASVTLGGAVGNLNAALLGLQYKPAANANGIFTLTMLANDNGNTGTGGAKTDSDTMNITVNPINDPPTANADSATAMKNSITGVSINVLGNDTTAPDTGETLTIQSVTQPANGAVTIEGGLVRYVPQSGFAGSDTFNYTISDGTSTASATVTITVAASNTNAAPINTLPATGTVSEDEAVTFTTITVDDADAGSGLVKVTLSVTGGGTLQPTAQVGVVITGDGSDHVELVGTIANLKLALASIVFTPPANANGEVTLTMLTDDNGNTGTDGPKTDSDDMTITIVPANDPPIANADTASVMTNSIAGTLINVIANDSTAPDSGETLTVDAINAVTHGTAAIEGNQVRFVPETGYSGTATFVYAITDGNGGTASATVTVTIAATNSNAPPVNTLPASASLNEDGSLTFTTISVTDPDAGSAAIQVTLSVTGGGAITAVPTSGVQLDGNGTATVVLTGTVANLASALDGLVYEPAANSNGTFTLTMVTDDLGNTGTGGAKTDTDMMTITVSAVNDPPIANDDSANVATNSIPGVLIPVLINDSIAPDTGETLTVTGVTQPATGGVASVESNQVRFIPTPSFSGTATFTYTISDGNGGTASATVAVDVGSSNVNDAPINTLPPTASVDEDTTLVFTTISVTDADSGSGPITVVLSVGGLGTLEIVNTAGVAITGNGTSSVEIVGPVASVIAALQGVRYTPAPNTNGGFTLTMNTTDNGNTGTGGAKTDTDSMIITVNPINDPPTANDDAATVTTNSIAGTPIDVLANDSGAPDGVEVLTLVNVSPASNGTATIDAGKIRYIPATGFSGTDTFTYQITDPDGAIASANVTVTVAATGTNLPPINTLPATAALDEDTTLLLGGLSVEDEDAGSAAIRVTLSVDGGTISVAPSVGTTITANDTASVELVGTVARLAVALGDVTYKPAANANGTFTLTMLADDLGNTGIGGPQTDTDTLTITVNPINDAPNANADTATVTANSTTGVLVPVLANDSITPDTGETLTITSVTTPNNGAASVEGSEIRYVPNSGFFGSDTFSYTISDGNGGTATATVTMTVGADDPNSAPAITAPNALSVDEDAVLAFSGDDLIVVSDADSGSAEIELRIAVAHGTVSFGAITGLTFLSGDGSDDAAVVVRATLSALNAALTTLTFRGDADFNGAASLTLDVDDLGNTGTGGAKQATATVDITVAPVNDNPTVTPDAPTVKGGATTTLDVLANDSSAPDGAETLTVSAVSPPTHGTATISADGLHVEYRPADGYTGPDSFTYTVSDGNGGTASATVSVTVVDPDANLPPVITLPSGVTTAEDTPVGVAIAVADPDAATDPLEVSLSVEHGTATLGVTGGITFVSGDGTDDTSLILRGSQDALTQALASLQLTPTANYNGTAALLVTVNDLGNHGAGGAKITTSTLAITVTPVNDPPTVNDDAATAKANGPVVVINVLANDSSAPDGNEVLTITSVSAPSSGSIAIFGSELRYTPSPTFVGTVTVTYQVSDGNGGVGTGTVTITVLPENSNAPPLNQVPASQTTPEDTVLVFSTDAANSLTIVDPDAGDAELSVTITTTHGTFSLGTTQDVTVTGDGTSMVTLSGTQSAINTVLAGARFTPDADYFGEATITIVTSDNGATGAGGAQSDTDTIAITVTPVNDPPVANPDAATVAAGESVTIDVLANDTSGPDEGETLALLGVAGAQHGTVAIVDGKVEYTPDAGYTGADSFTYIVGDGHGGTATGTVSVTVGSGTGDADGDGIPDDIETTTGTDPASDDSDGDGITDGNEDRNHNGVVDAGETDPRNADTDGDGLQDGTELGLIEPQGDDTDVTIFVPDADPTTKTDPLTADTDKGGIPDGVEDTNHNGKVDPGERDPLDPRDDSLADSDGDGLPDALERIGCTNWQRADTDYDGIPDGEEDKNHNGLRESTETDPCKPDTDDGGVADGEELTYGTDPLDGSDDVRWTLSGGGFGNCGVSGRGESAWLGILFVGGAMWIARRRRRDA